MPELPEVETVCRGLAKALTGTRIIAAAAHRADLRAPLPRDLGIEPLGPDFTPARLADLLRDSQAPIKTALLDQKKVVGIGNIYACEALYRAGIDPRRAAGTCTKADIRKLAAAIVAVLDEAIAAGGSSLRDYVQADGELGYFQHHFAVYGREGEACPGCTCRPHIQRITQAGRSTFFCPTKQR